MKGLYYKREQVEPLAKAGPLARICPDLVAADWLAMYDAIKTWHAANHAYAANAHVEEAAARYDALDAAEQALAAMVEETR